ncbi:MAG: glycosyltransferase family 2 protein, partial [Rickettsiales bacterium]
MTSVDRPLVSVFIPAYKTADTLEKAVNSALSQMQDVEVIIADDCSPDDTFELAQELARKDSRVKAFRLEKNSGAPAARNYAISQARGTWLAVLDADDWFEPGRLKALVESATEAGVEMAADNQYFFDKLANKIAFTALAQKGRKRVVDLDIFLKNSNATSHFDYGMMKPIFKADFMKKHNIEYYVPDRIGHDYCILLCFFAAGGKGVLIDTPYYNYVQPFGSISKKPQQEGRKPYDPTLQKNITQHFIDVYRNKFSAVQMAELERREREADALVCFYELRTALKDRNIGLALKTLAKTHFTFWKMMEGRVRKKISTKIFGLPPY